MSMTPLASTSCSKQESAFEHGAAGTSTVSHLKGIEHFCVSAGRFAAYDASGDLTRTSFRCRLRVSSDTKGSAIQLGHMGRTSSPIGRGVDALGAALVVSTVVRARETRAGNPRTKVGPGAWREPGRHVAGADRAGNRRR